MNIDNKQELRKHAKSVRSAADIKAISRVIVDKITSSVFYENSKNILAYYPFNSEIDLRKCFEDSSKNWFLPRVDMEKNSLVIYEYRHGDLLVKNKWGVLEPAECSEAVSPEKIDMIITPALMADKNGFRLGYGAGFYDKFLPLLKKDCVNVVVVCDSLLVETLPSDEWDVTADWVITELNQVEVKA